MRVSEHAGGYMYVRYIVRKRRGVYKRTFLYSTFHVTGQMAINSRGLPTCLRTYTYVYVSRDFSARRKLLTRNKKKTQKINEKDSFTKNIALSFFCNSAILVDTIIS